MDGRLEYIDKEIKRMDGTIRELQVKGEKMRGELGALQQEVQIGQQAAGSGAGAGKG